MLSYIFDRLFPHYETLHREQQKQIQKITIIFFIFAAIILGYFILSLVDNQHSDEKYWNHAFQSTEYASEDLQEVSKNATVVTAGTYIENIYSINMANGTYGVDFVVWFRWDGNKIPDMINNFRIYKGDIHKIKIIKDYVEGDSHYQIARVVATVSKTYWTKCFPLESHQLFFYIEPNYTAKNVVLVADKEESTVNRNISISGFQLEKFDVGVFPFEYTNTRSDIRLSGNKNIVTELVTGVQIHRDGWGLYMKCFIAMYGCLIWALLVLYINIYHRVDPLGMIPGALFGCVANVMVGANLLPDALQMGLLEYVNIWGILIILMAAVVIINVNAIRREDTKKGITYSYFAAIYGRIMLYVVTFFAFFGNIILPLIVYLNK